MKIKVDTEVFYGQLKRAADFIPKKSPFPINEFFHVEVHATKMFVTANDNNSQVTVRISCTSDVQTTVPGDEPKPFRFCIPGKKLSYTVSLLRDPHITLTIKTKGDAIVAEIKSGKNKYSMSCLPAEQFPMILTDNQKHHATVSFGMLRPLLKIAESMVNDDSVIDAQRAIRIYEENGKITICAAATQWMFKAAIASVSIISWDQLMITKGCSKLLRGLFEGDEEVDLINDGKKLIVKTEDATMVCIQLECKYPGLDAMVSKFMAQPQFTIRNTTIKLLEAVKRVNIYANNKDGEFATVNMSLDHEDGVKHIAMTSGNDNDSVYETIEIPQNIEEMAIKVNPEYLHQILSQVEEDYVDMVYIAASAPLIFFPCVGENLAPSKLFVLMPINA